MPDGAHRSQNRAIGLTLALAAPFVVAFITLPELIMSALFQRGAFDAAAAARSGAVLAAYAIGLPAAVLIRSAVASFYARSDTLTPLIASLAAVAVNVLIKIMLMETYGVVGLALGTAIGIWVNLVLLVFLATRRDWMAPSAQLGRILAAVAAATILLAPLRLVRARADLLPSRGPAALAQRNPAGARGSGRRVGVRRGPSRRAQARGVKLARNWLTDRAESRDGWLRSCDLRQQLAPGREREGPRFVRDLHEGAGPPMTVRA